MESPPRSAMQKTKSRHWFIIKNQTCAKTFTKKIYYSIFNLHHILYMHVKFGDKKKTADFLKI